MHKVAKITLSIGITGLTIFLFMFGISAYKLASSHDDVDWNDWIVYEVDSSEATLYLDGEIGYTIYVDDTYAVSYTHLTLPTKA